LTKTSVMPEKDGNPPLAESTKPKILGLTAAKLYGIRAVDPGSYQAVPKDYESRMTKELKTILEFDKLTADNMSRMKETYEALAIGPDNIRYGWMRVKA